MSSVRFYNTRTRSIEDFKPHDDTVVKLYTCGPTVYDYLHIGNWTAYIYWDVLVRTLEANQYKVERVMNITDVGHLVSDADDGEDKLEKGARRENKTAWDIARFYGDDFLQGMEKLNFILPQHITKATEYIDQQLDLVRTLKNKGYTYQIDDGIYFDTSKFPTYSDFAHLDLAAQKAGARVEFNDKKRSSSDFALWKFTPENEKRDMEWDTPQDILESDDTKKGFPGWHLECSAMAMDILGKTLDIHTGGIDHIPVHHTNEIAQSEAATGKQFSNFWLHNNHLKSNGTKISKSLGNGYTLEDLADKGFTPEDLRMLILQSSYQTEGNFTFENLAAAAQRLQNWRRTAALRHQTYDTLDNSNGPEFQPSYATRQALIEKVSDNLNTPEALSFVDSVFDKIESAGLGAINRDSLVEFLNTIDAVLGFKLIEKTPDITDEQKQYILKRTNAREAKEWKTADDYRAILLDENIVLDDTKHGTVWHYQKIEA